MAEPFAGAVDETAAKPVAEMSFEEALAELEGIVQKLERGQLELENSIQAYERGTALRQHCADKLRQVQLRVEKLTLDREGNAKLAPFEEG
jgi:exodeoxyribonuclease VII small subunit